ncbi:MAG: hypothetical protein ACP5SA_03140 [Candidatus Micrarchaeia archaeon]
MEFYRIEEIPNKETKKETFFEIMDKEPFVIKYDFSERCTIFGIYKDSDLKVQQLQGLMQGLKLAKIERKSNPYRSKLFSGYTSNPQGVVDGLFALPLFAGSLTIFFIPISIRDVEHFKKFIEKELTARKVRESNSESNGIAHMMVSSQRDVYDNTDEALILTNILNMIDESILKGGSMYRFFIAIEEEAEQLEKLVKANLLVLWEAVKLLDEQDIKALYKYPALPFSRSYLSNFISLKGRVRTNYVIETGEPKSSGDLILGTAMEGIKGIENQIKIDRSLLNLGFIITGLPGMGKTSEAMSIISQIASKNSTNTKIVIISPTSEWDGFAKSHGMNILMPYFDCTPINFFRKPPQISKEKFYENLAMVLASASNAGPYRNPMEKCMLNAFKRIYDQTDLPNPVEVYDEIEESIVKLHAKRTNTGIKYTKHGENIKSALENLRLILSRPEYSTKEGVKIEELMEKGVVFDLSNASISTRQYLYALILNLVYAFAANFDINNESTLKLLIVLEEAEILFSDKESTVVQDMNQRIQDFRKQGIGLIFMAHSVNEIESGIRRMCQLKLYFRQASDIAPIAVRDLFFARANDDEASLKLKTLEAGIGALSYITKEGNSKIPQSTVFIKTMHYNLEKYQPIYECNNGNSDFIDAAISLSLPNNEKDYAFARILFLGEEIGTFEIKVPSCEIKIKMLAERPYTLQLLDKKKRITKELRIKAKERMEIKIE